MQHGVGGSQDDFKVMDEILMKNLEKHGKENVHILKATSCVGITSDGVEKMGRLLAEEIHGALHFISVSEL